MRLLTQSRLIGRKLEGRRGIVIVVAAVLMIAIMGLAALAIDVGFIVVVRDQMQNAVDAAALAAGGELADGCGVGASRTTSEVTSMANAAGQTVAAANSMLDRNSAHLSASRDLTYGKRIYDSTSGTWSYQWGATPYDCVKATIRRDQAALNNGSITAAPDGQLNLFFARVLGNNTASYSSTAIAALKPAVGLRLLPSSASSQTLKILPITLDLQTWNDLISNTGSTSFGDEFSFDPDTGEVTSGPDGIREVNIYPHGSSDLPPGNRGTVDIGSANNSTAELSRQIRDGQNATDMAYFPNSELRYDNGSVVLNGDTGISAAIKDDLDAIIGQVRVMPLFTAVAGPGNNALYTTAKLVGIRVVYVKLTGSPSAKRVIVQPATFVSSQAITSNSIEITTDSIFGPVRLVE